MLSHEQRLAPPRLFRVSTERVSQLQRQAVARPCVLARGKHPRMSTFRGRSFSLSNVGSFQSRSYGLAFERGR